MMVAAGMLTLKGLKEQGRLGRSFGKVTIRDQPPSNTIQKIMAVKDAMRDVENFLQNVNVSLLKMRTIVLAGQTQVCSTVELEFFFFSSSSFSGGIEEQHPLSLSICFLALETLYRMEGLISLIERLFQITTEVALVVLSSAVILLIVPFKYVLSALIFDFFTRELQFRQETVKRFMKFLRERWDSVPASPVVVLPFDNDGLRSSPTQQKEVEQQQKPKD